VLYVCGEKTIDEIIQKVSWHCLRFIKVSNKNVLQAVVIFTWTFSEREVLESYFLIMS
jgi:hypothetical protein